MKSNNGLYLVSSCLVGLNSRYDGETRVNETCLAELTGHLWIPVCPEQLGGLPTPRVAADLVGGDGHDVLAGRARVLTRQGEDVTARFIHGARQVLLIAEAQPIHGLLLKARSPSCGLRPPVGVMAALFQALGYEIREFE